MTGSRIFGLRLDEGTRSRWDAAAEACGMKLAEFIKRCVEDRLAGPEAIRAALAAPASRGLCEPVKASERLAPSGKVFKGPDPKPGKPR